NWRNVRDIEFVALHYWVESRVPFKSIDGATREARLQWKPRMRLTDDHTDKGAPYYVENVGEALEKPGEWYLDRPSGRLTYLPRGGETIKTADIVAPRLPQLAILRGDAARGKPIEHVQFEGLTFSHSEWVPGQEALTAAPQAACHIPGALSFRHARQCGVRQCAIEHVGSYGVDLMEGCTDVQLTGNRIADLAGGGVKIWHTLPPKTSSRAEIAGTTAPRLSCRRIRVTDNEIADGSHRWRQAVGVLIGKCSGNQVLHNHIHDFDYTGISVGWTWGYAEGNAYGNIVEHNHIHRIGRGVLSDMGAIYLLSVSPGTRVRYNLIHDVESRGYGGWGIYTDEGSSFILIENNVVYRTKSAGFHQHYGRENLVRNNIFAFGREAQFTRSRLESHSSFTLTGNIFYFDVGDKVATGDWTGLRAVVDRNLYFNTRGKPLEFAGGTLRRWQRRGMDRHSLVADPRFVAPRRGDFRLKRGSPAAKIGFVPIDVSDVGPRKNGEA
ncbi:MAG: right-handed parallel beta-helix repeat-containing protein, partial [Lentisphaerae bacterium]|nr:right-handed parallel beta-helix repeat-containing protein [Lentisphaerota bacterium]